MEIIVALNMSLMYSSVGEIFPSYYSSFSADSTSYCSVYLMLEEFIYKLP